jgi:hypothetical protein
VFTIAGIGVHDARNPCSASVGIGVHDGPEWVFTIGRNTQNARGCGNDAPMEIKKRFPQELGNLAEEREIPTFPQADSSFQGKERRRT